MKIFIAGPRAVKELDENILKKLNNICNKNFEILVGDANGIDSSIQYFFKTKNYKNVKVYASNGFARNNLGNWIIECIQVDPNISGFDFYVQKDLAMVKNADIGFMIWNGKSKGTFNNIINLLHLQKEVVLYYLPNKKFYKLKEINDLTNFLNTHLKLTNTLKKIFNSHIQNSFIQECIF